MQSNDTVSDIMVRAIRTVFEAMGTPPSPRTVLGILFAADVIALGAVIGVAAATVGLLAVGIDVTGPVVVSMDAAAVVFSEVGAYLVGASALYTVLYLAVGVMATATIVRCCVFRAQAVQATQVLSCVLSRLVRAWLHRASFCIRFQIPTYLLRCAGKGRDADHLVTGWSAALHPTLAYE